MNTDKVIINLSQTKRSVKTANCKLPNNFLDFLKMFFAYKNKKKQQED